MSSSDILSELNESQHAAATYMGQHCLVLAGAGCGKTKTIIARCAFLIDQGVRPERIKVLTFTRRSAGEIIERVAQHIGLQAHGLNASTFHTWCISLIRKAPEMFGVKDYSIIDADDQTQLFKSLRGRSEKKLPTSAELASLNSYMRNTGCTLKEAVERMGESAMDCMEEIAIIMHGYTTKKNDGRLIDYDDILDVVARQLNAGGAVRDWVMKQYDHILVDEFQDTNPLQWRLLSPLKDGLCLYCVGDDAQSIYAFRGADFHNVHSFTERVPTGVVLKLERNYRSVQEILDVSNWVLDQSKLSYDKRLTAHRGHGDKPRLISFVDEWAEARWIVQNIVDRRDNECMRLNQHMVVTRTSRSARALESILVQRGINYQFIGGTKLLESAHIRDVISVVKLINNTRDEISWMRYLTMFEGVGEKGAYRFASMAIQCNDIESVFNFAGPHLGKIPLKAMEIITELSDMDSPSIAKILERAFELLEPVVSKGYEDWERRKRDFPVVVSLAEKHSTMQGFIDEYLLDPVYTGTTAEVEDKLTVITVHSAKGTECEVVYCIGSNPSAYPSTRSDTPDKVEEDRRVLYVALTRAKDELFVTRHGPFEENGEHADHHIDEAYFFRNMPGSVLPHEKSETASMRPASVGSATFKKKEWGQKKAKSAAKPAVTAPLF